MNETLETVIFTIIGRSGEAKSAALESIQAAKNGNFEEAEGLLEESRTKLGQAHVEQTKLIQNEANGEKVEISLLIIHAQDHLMNAINMKDLAVEFVELYKKFEE
jgi:PTS system cellobiose-specific IIA component